MELRDVELKYRPELPSVLRGLSMRVAPGEKIGIVGRTGAGKSSIMTALYRLVELTSGSIHIDGVDVSKVGLTDLRQGLAIIPQDPVRTTKCRYAWKGYSHISLPYSYYVCCSLSLPHCISITYSS